jgi:myo-inositol-1(or 4)-monophosphatase
VDLEAMRSVARSAALVGAEAVRDGVRPEVGAAKGLPGDWVTEVDLASERAIAGFLAAETPSVPFVGEELSGGALASGLRWVVDPLDGTTNYVHDFWAVGVSVALVDGDRPVAGAIAAPFLQEVWHAAAGAGAVWERASGAVECRVSSRPAASAVVATGFPFRRKERLPRYLATMTAALEAFEDLRRPGAACLDLAWTACGVFDGFFELGLAAWDVAAGGLLVQEAGGVVSDWSGDDGWLGGDILAGTPAVHEVLRSVAHDPPPLAPGVTPSG